MHELGIVFYIIKACEKAAQENNAKSIKEITLEVGEVSTIVPSYFKDCFSWAIKKNDLMKDCTNVNRDIARTHAVELACRCRYPCRKR